VRETPQELLTDLAAETIPTIVGELHQRCSAELTGPPRPVECCCAELPFGEALRRPPVRSTVQGIPEVKIYEGSKALTAATIALAGMEGLAAMVPGADTNPWIHAVAVAFSGVVGGATWFIRNKATFDQIAHAIDEDWTICGAGRRQGGNRPDDRGEGREEEHRPDQRSHQRVQEHPLALFFTAVIRRPITCCRKEGSI
jgi:hypothetical protein